MKVFDIIRLRLPIQAILTSIAQILAICAVDVFLRLQFFDEPTMVAFFCGMIYKFFELWYNGPKCGGDLE